jgi:predicted dehydrogenase
MVNWAIVGLGDIVRKRVATAIREQPKSTLYACVTRNPESRKADIESFAPQKVYDSLDRMLADPRVDVVYLATPVWLHAPQTIASLRAGKDVLVEKPMALDARESAEMCAVAEETGRRLAAAYYRRYWARFELVKEMLDRGDLGRVLEVRMALHGWYRPDPGEGGAWRLNRELSGGGVLSDVGCHRLDLAAWWFGLPRRVVADVSTRVQDYDVEDSAYVLMEWAGGVRFVGSFLWSSKTRTDEIDIVGTEAKIALRPCDGPDVTTTVGAASRRRELPRPANAHRPLIDEFTSAVIEDRPLQFTGPDGMGATQIIDAIHKSAKEGSWLEID